MLRLITGPAGAGKTDALTGEILRFVKEKKGGIIYIVPEQYSHEAERELCARCGDSLSLYAEVLSFTSLARKLRSECGGTAQAFLDDGGRLLSMAAAAKQLHGRLRCFKNAGERPDLQKQLLKAVDTMKQSCLSPEQLIEAAAKSHGDLADKLRDLADVSEVYSAVVGNSGADPSDATAVLARQIPGSSIGEGSRIYIDGFSDFTAAELAVIKAMLKAGADVTVCLTLDDDNSGSEIFSLQRSSAKKLTAMAEELGIEHPEPEGTRLATERQSAAVLFAQNMFSFTDKTLPGAEQIELWKTQTVAEECELAASRAIELVRETGCRWRDIAVAVRGFDDYAAALESAFENYGVPLFSARRTPVASKPLPLLIAGAYEIIRGGWQSDAILSYLGTGLTGLSPEERDELGDYVYIWQLSGGAWKEGAEWRQHPDGIGKKRDEASDARLCRIAELKERLAAPLRLLEQSSRSAVTAAEQAEALSEFLISSRIPGILAQRAESLESAGRGEAASEYRQLWDLTVRALEQVHAVAGDARMNREEFAEAFMTVLSGYDIGVIPVSLDRVSAGDFDRMRRRNIKHLIILGATDERIPRAGENTGLFSDAELKTLEQSGIRFGGSFEDEIWREYSLIYSCAALPSEKLIISMPASDEDGETRASVAFTRAERLFCLEPRIFNASEAKLSALRPARVLASCAGEPLSAAAAECVEARLPGELDRIKAAASRGRGQLSPASAESLYGREIKISASKAETFSYCRYQYFCKYGLEAEPREIQTFTAAEFGTFAHYILEHTAADVKNSGGFEAVDDDFVSETARKHIDDYVHTELDDFAGKSGRFIYLFRRAEEDVLKITADTAKELRRSSFEPVCFELNFGDRSLFPPIQLGDGCDLLNITGIADRVDAWENDGKTYIRIADYKTGSKEFSLSDLWYGLSMQMLLYLYAIQTSSPETLEKLGLSSEGGIVPAGIMYVPARNDYTLTGKRPEEAEADWEKKAESSRKRSGLVLTADGVPEAWERGEEKSYIPLSFGKGGEIKEDNAVSPEQFELLYGHIRRRLTEMAEALHGGSIEASPLMKNKNEGPCRFCDYKSICAFSEGENGDRCRNKVSMKDDEVWMKMAEEERRNG